MTIPRKKPIHSLNHPAVMLKDIPNVEWISLVHHLQTEAKRIGP